MNHLILFDIDGTLLRAPKAGRMAFERAFFELHQVKDVWGNLKAHGRTDHDIIDEVCQQALGRSLTDEELKTLSDRFAAYFAETVQQAEGFSLMPGIVELLEQLSPRDNTVLGIQTGNIRETALLKLKRGDIDHHFLFGGYGCDSRDRAQIIAAAIERGRELISNPTDPLSITVIGDSVNDVKAAHANNARAIAVGTGGESLDTFRQMAGDIYVFDTLEDTSQTMRTILNRK